MSGAAALLDSLAETIRRQLSFVQAGELDEVDELADSAETMAVRAARMAPEELARHAGRIELVRNLRKRLRLAVAGRKDELAMMQGRLHKGKDMLKAYGWPGATASPDSLKHLQDTIR